jgi:hypothetical protein
MEQGPIDKSVFALDIALVLTMPRFEIYADGTHIGWSELEHGDPPMGVAHGRFFPAIAYSAIQTQVIAETDSGKTSYHFQVKTPNQVWVEAVATSISDYSREVGAEGIEISVLGISSPPYEVLFLGHVEAYRRSFQQQG